MVGVMVLTASPGLTSEQRPEAFVSGVLFPEAGESKTKPTPWLDGTPWPLTVSPPEADDRNQPNLSRLQSPRRPHPKSLSLGATVYT
jgi:hypothetical protein